MLSRANISLLDLEKVTRALAKEEALDGPNIADYSSLLTKLRGLMQAGVQHVECSLRERERDLLTEARGISLKSTGSSYPQEAVNHY